MSLSLCGAVPRCQESEGVITVDDGANARVTRVPALMSPTLDTIAVLYGVATPLRAEILVTDTTTNITRRYVSPYGASQGGSDFAAFVK